MHNQLCKFFKRKMKIVNEKAEKHDDDNDDGNEWQHSIADDKKKYANCN